MWNASPCPSLSVAIIWWHSGAVVNIINPAEEGLGVLMCQCVRFLPLIPPRVTKNMYQVDIHSRTMAAAGQMQQYIYVDMRYMCVHVTPTSCLPVLDRRVPAVQLSLRFILLSFVFLIFQVKVRGCSIWRELQSPSGQLHSHTWATQNKIWFIDLVESRGHISLYITYARPVKYIISYLP